MSEYEFDFVVRHRPHLKGRGRFIFDRREPFIVQILLSLGGQEETAWVCDIDLLRRVLNGQSVGAGDIQFYVQPHNPTSLVLYLSGEEEYIELLLKRSDVTIFYSMTYVPPAERTVWVADALDELLDEIFS